MKVQQTEATKCLKELKAFIQESPIGYARGRNIVILERELLKVDQQFKAQRNILIDQLASKDEEGKPILVMKKDGAEYNFGENQDQFDLRLEELRKYTYVENEDGTPIEIEIEFYKVTQEKADKFLEMNFTGLAYTLEFIFP